MDEPLRGVVHVGFFVVPVPCVEMAIPAAGVGTVFAEKECRMNTRTCAGIGLVALALVGVLGFVGALIGVIAISS